MQTLLYGLLGFGVVGGACLWLHDKRARTQPPKLFVVKDLGGYHAKTIAPFGIFVVEAQRHNAALLAHEQIHWQKYQRLGLVQFYSQYFSQYQQLGYDRMPMEIEARAMETPYCRTNYTECVRNGTAKTVQNPKFRQ